VVGYSRLMGEDEAARRRCVAEFHGWDTNETL